MTLFINMLRSDKRTVESRVEAVESIDSSDFLAVEKLEMLCGWLRAVVGVGSPELAPFSGNCTYASPRCLVVGDVLSPTGSAAMTEVFAFLGQVESDQKRIDLRANLEEHFGALTDLVRVLCTFNRFGVVDTQSDFSAALLTGVVNSKDYSSGVYSNHIDSVVGANVVFNWTNPLVDQTGAYRVTDQFAGNSRQVVPFGQNCLAIFIGDSVAPPQEGTQEFSSMLETVQHGVKLPRVDGGFQEDRLRILGLTFEA